MKKRNRNERKKSSFLFSRQQLQLLGYTEQPDGSWTKPSTPHLDRLEAGEHTQQEGALERETQTARSGKTRSAKSSRRKRPAEIIVTMTAHLNRYLDSDNLAGALKPIRDELADWIGIDDGDHRILWEVDQTLTRGTPGVCVTIRRA